MKKALLKVGYSCNSRCVFCHSSPLRRHADLSTATLKARVGLAARRGAGMVVFSGGEPTIRRDILELAGHAQSLGLATGLITNGRRFLYPAFGRELRSLGLSFVYMSFHSVRPKAHELTTRTDSFRQTVAALRNLAALGVELTVNVVVTRRNIAELREIVDFLAGFKPAMIKLSVLEPKGAALDAPELEPPLERTAAAIGAALRHGRARHPGQRFGCEGLTPCLLEDFDALNDDLLTRGFTLFQESFERAFASPDHLNRGKAPACFDCSRLEDCPGVFTGYLGRAEPAPVKAQVRPRSNSFVYVGAGRTLPLPREARKCPGRGEDARTIYIGGKGGATAWRTLTRDFSEAEISRIRGLGQLYAASRGRHEDLDYARDLVKLEVARLCARCPDRGGCSRLYEPSASRVFEPLEERLRGLVRGLRGDVLEVGCGAVRFRKEVEAGVRAGRMTYLGVDPELPADSERPGLSLRRLGIEEFSAPDASFDHVLLLRSYNHLREPSRVFPELRRMLRPGGRLVVVDGTAFGLALERAPRQAGPDGFHHYRNHTSRQAREMLEALGLRAVREVPVVPRGGSEWLLELRKS